ncbi:hypothetical protein [Terrisporobacter sp.]|uniref:hypothetical protein n=1 Tax=Terrisporobacter sp. TaxID=1965305 RepID=UPI00262A592D|nr:hypothetical protein [Terrisporobacter sp.]
MKKKRIKKPKTFEQYIEWLIQEGYTKENGEPIKCEKCGCKKFKNENYYCGESWVEEYTVKCKSCGTIVGHWAYGNWQI